MPTTPPNEAAPAGAKHRSGFTLIELLAVVSILTLLVALLLPALREARYQAKLAACGARLKQMGVGVMGYASDHFGHYPYRSVNTDSPNPKRTKLAYYTGGPGGDPHWDDRERLKRAVPMKMFQCPLSETPPERLDLGEAEARDIHGSYELYFGSRIARSEPAGGLMRSSDKSVRWGGRRFDVLAADMDWAWRGKAGFSWRFAAHPDRRLLRWQTANNPLNAGAWWRNFDGAQRGPIDRNFLHVDGSVRRLTALKSHTDDEPRVVRVPSAANRTGSLVYNFLPSE